MNILSDKSFLTVCIELGRDQLLCINKGRFGRQIKVNILILKKFGAKIQGKRKIDKSRKVLKIYQRPATTEVVCQCPK